MYNNHKLPPQFDHLICLDMIRLGSSSSLGHSRIEEKSNSPDSQTSKKQITAYLPNSTTRTQRGTTDIRRQIQSQAGIYTFSQRPRRESRTLVSLWGLPIFARLYSSISK